MTTREWQPVIGLEIHAQLATRSKMFSGAATVHGAEPNSQVSALDAALPGTLPVANAAAVRMAVRFGLAIGARIAPRSVFARKNYFYPDLPKGYQISQYELPIVSDGMLPVRLDDGRLLHVPIERAHLEEDAGKSLHDAFQAETGIDLNRAGIPLLEIVSRPALHSPQDAAAYMRAVHRLVRWIGICDGNLQEGSFRCDANVSVRPHGESKLGTRVEVKNLNSFRFIEKAIAYEIERQTRALEKDERIVQETRLYDAAHDRTRPMRSKESAHDYRYFPDPDLPPLIVDEMLVSAERATLPELPETRRRRHIEALGLPDADATQLCADKPTADYFEAMLALCPGEAKSCANWVLGEVAAALNASGLSIEHAPVAPAQIVALLARVREGAISGRIAKDVFAAMWAGEGDVDAIMTRHGLRQISDATALAVVIDAVFADFPTQVADFRNGQDKLFQFFIGQVMKRTRGQANPQQINALLREKLHS